MSCVRILFSFPFLINLKLTRAAFLRSSDPVFKPSQLSLCKHFRHQLWQLNTFLLPMSHKLTSAMMEGNICFIYFTSRSNFVQPYDLKPVALQPLVPLKKIWWFECHQIDSRPKWRLERTKLWLKSFHSKYKLKRSQKH